MSPTAFPPCGPAPLLLCVYLWSPRNWSSHLPFHTHLLYLLLGGFVFLPESNPQHWIKTGYTTIQPSAAWAKNYLQHRSRSQLNKAYHAFDKKARLWLYLKSGWRARLWDMKKRREKTTHTLQSIRRRGEKKRLTHRRPLGQKLENESDPLAWDVTHQNCLLSMQHPSSDQSSSVWGRLPTPAIWVSSLTPVCRFLYFIVYDSLQ